MSPIRFNADDHTYADDDGPLVAVTRVLALIVDYSDMPDAVRATALERGRLVHDAIAADNAHDLDEARYFARYPDHVGYVEAWRSFCTQRRFVPVLNEYLVGSPAHRIAGTIDTLGTLDGHGALVDYKTGRPAEAATDLQTAGYLALALESAKAGDDVLAEFFARYPVVRRYAIQLKADGRFIVEAYTDATNFRDFFLLAAAHHVIAGRTKPRRIEAA